MYQTRHAVLPETMVSQEANEQYPHVGRVTPCPRAICQWRMCATGENRMKVAQYEPVGARTDDAGEKNQGRLFWKSEIRV